MLELGSESDFSTIAVNFTMSFLLTLHQVTYATHYIIKGIKGDIKDQLWEDKQGSFLWVGLTNCITQPCTKMILAHQRVLNSSIFRASDLEHGGSWVWIPSGVQIFLCSLMVTVNSYILHPVTYSLVTYYALAFGGCWLWEEPDTCKILH